MLNISLKFPTTISSFFITISPSHWYPYHLSYIEAIMSPIIYSAMTSKDLSTCGNIFPFYSRPTIIMDDHGPHEWPIRHPSFLNLLSFLDLHFHSSPIIHSNTYTLDLVKISQALQLSLYSQLSFDTQPFISTTLFSDYFGTFSHSAPLFIPTISLPTCPQSWESNLGNLWPLLSHTPWFSLMFSQSTNMPPSSPSLPGFLPISHLSHLICPPSGLTYVWATSSAYYIPQMQDLSVSVFCMIQILQFLPDALGISPSSGEEAIHDLDPTSLSSFISQHDPHQDPDILSRPQSPKGPVHSVNFNPLPMVLSLSGMFFPHFFDLADVCLCVKIQLKHRILWDAISTCPIRLLPTITALLFIHSSGWAFGDPHYSTSCLMVVSVTLKVRDLWPQHLRVVAVPSAPSSEPVLSKCLWVSI